MDACGGLFMIEPDKIEDDMFHRIFTIFWHSSLDSANNMCYSTFRTKKEFFVRKDKSNDHRKGAMSYVSTEYFWRQCIKRLAG